MGADIGKWMGIVFILVMVYLVIKGGSASTSIINSLSGANTNAILALQGRDPQASL
jgi:hypothetical protein